MADTDSYKYPQFFTATILEWKYLLANDSCKDIIVNSLLFLKKEQSIVVNGFVIMPNHIHLLWQIKQGLKRENIKMRFFKFTAQQIKFKLKYSNDAMLSQFFVNAKDRQYRVRERNSLSIDLWTQSVFEQKPEEDAKQFQRDFLK